MADKYWIATGAATTANTASNWNTAADGTGSTGVPATNDTVIFGHDDTFAANLGTAPCTWDLALTLTRFQTLSNFNAITTDATTDVEFVASSKSIIFTEFDPVALGFKPGMEITTSGSASNNGQDIIASVNNTTIVTVGSLTDEAAGANVTITYDPYVDLQAHISTTRLDLDCHLKNTSGSNKNVNLSGAYPASDTYVFNGVDAQISNRENLSYVYDSSANGTTAMVFDNGPYPKVILGGSSAYYSPASGVPIVNSSPSSFYSLNISTGTFFQPDPSTVSPRNDSKKQFIIDTTSTFTMACNKFDAGLSTFEFVLDGSAFEFPVTGSATYGAADNTFIANWCHVILSSAAGGRKATIPAGRTLSVNSLLVGSDAVLEGHKTADSHVTSTVISISRPKIEGAWNFSQMGDGIYVSLLNDAYPVTPSDGPVGRVQLSNDGGTFNSDSKLTWTSATSTLLVDGKLTVTGLIDPTGMVFTPQATNPETANPEDTIWVNSETGHLMRGDRDVESIIHINVRNDEGSTIPLGAPLYSKGEIGGSERIKVGIADANDTAKMPCIGIAMTEMNTSSTKDSNCIAQGIFNENITGFTGLSVGDTLYVSNTGGLTKTRPTGTTDKVQNIGIVLKTNGTICQALLVSAIGRSNDTPNDSYITVDTTTHSPQSRRLVAGTNITLTDGGAGGDLTISSSGGGGGGSGTVTSVAVSGSDGIQVDSGSPITTSGTIALGVDKNTLLSHINVEDGADVTDTANVRSAGALMDDEVTNLAQVKAFDSADYATAAQGVTADGSLPKAGGTMTGNITMAGSQTVDGRDLSVDGAKLDGIAAGADVALPVANNNTVLINTNTADITTIKTKAKMSVQLSANFNYSSGGQKIPHDLVMWDTGGDFDPINHCFVAPRDGHYLVTCSYYFTAAPSWGMTLVYVDDGTGYAIRVRRLSANGQDNMISAVVQVGAGHKIAHYAWGSSSSTVGAALNTLTYFQVTEIL